MAIIEQTKKWLTSVVIGYNLCPFARREFETGRIDYTVITAEAINTQLEKLILNCIKLDRNTDIVTSLLILPNGLADFEDYLNLLDIATALMKEYEYEGVYQLASFHPDYCFEGVSRDDPTHYTNRSPYPMLHVLREASVEEAIKTHPDPHTISSRNIDLMRKLGIEAVKTLLASC